MRLRIIFILIITLIIHNTFSQQPTQTLRGRVLDAESKIPLPGVNIFIINTEPLLGSSTDVEGNFRIAKMPIGRYNIKVSFMGYEDKIINEVLIGSAKEVVLTIEIAEKVTKLKEVVVQGQNSKQLVMEKNFMTSIKAFSVEESKRYAASLNDPSRLAMSFAGVTFQSDKLNEIIIRGNNPSGLGWRLEGVEIPGPNHFVEEGSAGGGVSILSSNMMGNSTFLTGAFPAEFGNAIAGVFDIKLRNGNNEKREYVFQAGFMGIDLAAEGPFKKGRSPSYLFNYRYSNLGLLNLLGFKLTGNAVPSYQDFSFKVLFPTQKFGVFSLFGLGGFSRIRETFPKRLRTYDSYLGIFGLSNYYQINKKTNLKTVISYAATVINYLDEFKLDSNAFYYKQYFGKGWLRFSTTLSKKINSSHSIQSGFFFSELFYDGHAGHYYYNTKKYISMGKEKGSTSYLQFFTSWKYRITQKLTLNTGIHVLQFLLNHRVSFEPRLNIQWQFLSNQSLSFGYGKHSKLESLVIYLREINYKGVTQEYNAGIDLMKAHHFVIAYNYLIKENLNLHFEAYYQYLYDVPVRYGKESTFSLINKSNAWVQYRLTNTGTGRNMGIELTLEKYFANNYFFMINGTLYDSKYIGSDNVERNSRYNGHFSSNLVAGKEFVFGKKKNQTIGSSIKCMYLGGCRYSPIDLKASIIKGSEVKDINETYSGQYPNYFRTDFQLSYRLNKNKIAHEIRIDIQNLTNQKNVFDYMYDDKTHNIKTSWQTGIMPVLSYRLEF